MPTRRIFEVALVVVILSRPALGVVHMWSLKQRAKSAEGTAMHKVASVVSALS